MSPVLHADIMWIVWAFNIVYLRGGGVLGKCSVFLSFGKEFKLLDYRFEK